MTDDQKNAEINGGLSAHPKPIYVDIDLSRSQAGNITTEGGLTKREHFAALALQGILAGPLALILAEGDPTLAAEKSRHVIGSAQEFADLLLVKLSETSK